MASPKKNSDKDVLYTVTKDSLSTIHYYLNTRDYSSASIVQSNRFPNHTEFVLEENLSKNVMGQSMLTLKTFGTREGFTVTRTEGGSRDLVEMAEYRVTPLPLMGMSMSRVACASGVVRVSENVLDSVTRQKIQEFAKRNPEIAEELKKNPLPIVQHARASKAAFTSASTLTFAEAIDTPSEFQACPDHMPNVVVDKLNKKSATR